MLFSRFVIAACHERSPLPGHMPAISRRRIGHSLRFALEYFRLDEREALLAAELSSSADGNYLQLSFYLGSVLITAVGFAGKKNPHQFFLL